MGFGNRRSSGVQVGVRAGGAFGDLIVSSSVLSFFPDLKTKPKQTNGTFERIAHIPHNQLLDQLFALFREAPRWSIPSLHENTQQPEAYLKEVLATIAFLHTSEEHNGFRELKEIFKDDSVRSFT